MQKFKATLLSILLSICTLSSFSQNPDYVDPGNVRGDEGTAYLWQNPEYYVPVLVIVVLVVALGILRRKKKKA